MTRAWISLAPALALGPALLAARRAEAARPVLAGEATHGVPGGALLVHYATTGADAVPTTDTNGDGVPDFVTEVAAIAEDALARLEARGFRRPLSDGALGGDGRIDIYLRDLVSADGNAGTDGCTGDRCVGYVVAENDFAGFSYPSATEGITSVVPHEIFHLVQYAYSAAQPTTWTEGTAVWAVEHLYGDANGDFERFLPAFLGRTYRPLERAGGGFGDGYAYGAALWPYFLEQRFGADVIVGAWAACEDAPFLDAVARALEPAGAELDAAFTELTRWNLFTGPRAAGRGYPDAHRWPEVPREPALGETGRIYIEGLSARYVPLVAGAELRHVVVAPSGGIRVAAWVVPDGGSLADGVELGPEGSGGGAALAATLDPGAYTLVVTGLARNSIATAVDVSLVAAPEPDPSGDGGGCHAAPGAGAPLALLALAGLRRRRGQSSSCSSSSSSSSGAGGSEAT
ncbi:MAG: MXAN_6640 family putative metalloprotease [Kofleriaceae bacterium]